MATIYMSLFLSLFRYHMFLTSMSKTCMELGFNEASEDFSAACEYITSAASHTNTMMWIGKMDNCPLDLSGQGQLLKQGQVLTRSLTGSIKKGRKWSTSSQKPSTCHLFLFQQTIVLCKTTEDVEDQNNSHLSYIDHIRYISFEYFVLLEWHNKSGMFA